MDEIRQDRINFMNKLDTFKNKICRENCLDVCIDYNNRVELFKNKESA
jgi:hypothetical protein